MSVARRLPKPKWFNSRSISNISIDAQRISNVGQEANHLKQGYQIGFPENDTLNVALYIIDPQIDFVFPGAPLAVDGAVDDMVRLVDFITNNVDRITSLEYSMDTHLPHQIFSPTWWVDRAGNLIPPYTQVKTSDINVGKYRPLFMEDHSKAYVETLEKGGKKILMIWPPHTLLGDIGHALVPAVYEAAYYWSVARDTNPTIHTKGKVPGTEHYSAIGCEVPLQGVPESQINGDFLEAIAKRDRIVIAGEAKSHCVIATVGHIVEFFAQTNPELIKKIYILMDCMSSVKHPDVDFETLSMNQYNQWQQDYGLNLVTTQDEDKIFA